jgi:hypothetical protein
MKKQVERGKKGIRKEKEKGAIMRHVEVFTSRADCLFVLCSTTPLAYASVTICRLLLKVIKKRPMEFSGIQTFEKCPLMP